MFSSRRQARIALALLVLGAVLAAVFSGASYSSSSASSAPASAVSSSWLRRLRRSVLSEGSLTAVLPTWAHLTASFLLARQAPIVVLRQGTVMGTIRDDSDFPQPLEAFLGVPYALPPTGQRRFARPEPVGKSSRKIDASQYGPRCVAGSLDGDDWGEDCLSANIFRPMETKAGQKLPVLVYFHGGAFNLGAGRFHNTAALLAWSEKPFIALNFNYRLGAFGFLSGVFMTDTNLLNVGLHDQLMLLKWIQENIEQFGGDPNQVTIMGLSAGAHSIGHQVMYTKYSRRPLFHRALLESGATTARAVYPSDAPLPSVQFDEFVLASGCSNIDRDEIISCLREKPVRSIGQASIDIFNRYNPSDRWAFQPVIDGKIIRVPPILAWESGIWNKVPILAGFNTDEGSPFAPSRLDSSEDFTEFFKELIPALSESDLEELNNLYPDPAVHAESPYLDTRPIDVGSQYKRATAAYGQYAYICPIQQTAYHASAGQPAPVFLYHWAVNTTVKGGASHGDQSAYELYNPGIRKVSQTQDLLAGYLHAYFTSFVTTGDPNGIKGRYADRPKWAPFTPTAKSSTMVMGEGNDERAGGDSIGIVARMGNISYTKEECDFWWKRTILSES
ncbi:acetylcholinesterase [Nannizzia gypsea CBS 118893]|uniref:Carboxylic ester hydrolase n=1 Tax=Arthroderma gypseum (strain ATCC MYA-4604 / CBS 118893) TaxID=535722 RepID=E4V4C1_ARTGP|nr:acetylcholinesterase [Nannizzia gypsea CBS 118893]EFR04845.1 acetylcholinesterase [Nannizzia gypsea CBS 118893]